MTSAGAVGGVFVAADVPDFEKAKLAVSGLILGQPRRVPADPSDALADLVPIAPTVRREFSAPEPVLAFLRIYQRGVRTPAAVQGLATIVDSSNRQVFTMASASGRNGFPAIDPSTIGSSSPQRGWQAATTC